MMEGLNVKTVEDLSYGLREYPFVYKGMPIEEYEKELKYYGDHIQDAHKGTYKPLWKQRGENH